MKRSKGEPAGSRSVLYQINFQKHKKVKLNEESRAHVIFESIVMSLWQWEKEKFELLKKMF